MKLTCIPLRSNSRGLRSQPPQLYCMAGSHFGNECESQTKRDTRITVNFVPHVRSMKTSANQRQSTIAVSSIFSVEKPSQIIILSILYLCFPLPGPKRFQNGSKSKKSRFSLVLAHINFEDKSCCFHFGYAKDLSTTYTK